MWLFSQAFTETNGEVSPMRLLFLSALIVGYALFSYKSKINRSKKEKYRPWIIMDIQGSKLTPLEQKMISHPFIAGVVLGQQKKYGYPEIGGVQYESLDVVKNLVNEIKTVNPNLMVTIDHEGNRINHIKGAPKEPFISELLSHYPEIEHQNQSYAFGTRVGALLNSLGIDVIFGPVVDLAYGQISDRAISTNPTQVIKIAKSYIEGIQSNGVQTVLKHFPGLGGIETDTHHSISTMKRDFTAGLSIFQALADTHSWIMKGHAIYADKDPFPASISQYWATQAKDFITISDDISMNGLAQPFEEKLELSRDLNTYTIVMHSQPDLLHYLQKHDELKKLK